MSRRNVFVTTNTAAATSVTVPVSGIQPGDTVIFAVCGGNAGGGARTWTFPTGFTPFGGTLNTPIVGLNISNTNTFAAALKVAGTEGSNYVATFSVNDFITGIVFVYSGRDASAPVRAYVLTPNQFGAPPTFSYTLGNVAALPNDDVLQVWANRFYDNNALNFTGQAGFGNARIDYSPFQYSPAILSEDWVGYTGGSIGLNAGSLTTANTNSQGWGGLVVALKQAPSPPVTATYNRLKRFGPGVSPDYLQMYQRSLRGFTNPTSNVNVGLTGSKAFFLQGNPIRTTAGAQTVPLTGTGAVFSQGLLTETSSTGISIPLRGNAAVFSQGTVGDAFFGTSPFTLPFVA